MKVEIVTRGVETSANAGSSNGRAKHKICAKLVEKLGGGYSSTLGIDVASAQSEEIFKWFLASLLFSDSINEGIAIKTYRECEKKGLLSPQAILEMGLEGLVTIFDQGDYGSYTFIVATRILEAAEGLKDKYEGDINRLHFSAADETDLENRLRKLAKGIGTTMVDMFLREMRDIWEKTEPPLLESAMLAARKLRLIQTTDVEAGLEQLKAMLETDELRQCRFSDLEVALIRLGKNYCRKKQCSPCPVKTECQNPK
ncbi:MAG TPA: hypothetical protein G4O17_02055 [Dehalococcoidia bacterium]|nr:hypothetical protein [Dehalococcoidia bacterium]